MSIIVARIWTQALSCVLPPCDPAHSGWSELLGESCSPSKTVNNARLFRRETRLLSTNVVLMPRTKSGLLRRTGLISHLDYISLLTIMYVPHSYLQVLCGIYSILLWQTAPRIPLSTHKSQVVWSDLHWKCTRSSVCNALGGRLFQQLTVQNLGLQTIFQLSTLCLQCSRWVHFID